MESRSKEELSRNDRILQTLTMKNSRNTRDPPHTHEAARRHAHDHEQLALDDPGKVHIGHEGGPY